MKLLRSLIDLMRPVRVNSYRDHVPVASAARGFLTLSRPAALLSAGNVTMASGAVCTDEEVCDAKRELFDYARRHVQR